MTRTPNQGSTPATSVTDDEGLTAARAWIARQLRFEHLLGSLERRVVGSLDEVARAPRR